MHWKNKFGKILILLAAIILILSFVVMFFIRDDSTLDAEGKVDVILFAGQSNMVGYGEKASEYIIKQGDGYEYLNNSDELVNIKDPVGERTGRDANKALKGSMIPAFTYYYLKNTDHKMIAVPSGYGATSAENWQPDGKCLTETTEKYNNALEYIENNTKFHIHSKILIWLQGETDILLGTSKEKYKEEFMNIYESLKKSSGISTCIMIPSGSREDAPLENAEAINAAQYELISENDDIVLGSESAFKFSLDKNMLKTDNLHFNTKALELLGKESALNYFSLQE